MGEPIRLDELLRFWAKTTHDEKWYPNAYHPLLCHMIDVAVVTQMMWDEVLSQAAKKRIAEALGLSPDWTGLGLAGRNVSWIAGLHDLGKASPLFAWRGDNKKTRGLLRLFEKPPFEYLGEEAPAASAAPHGYVTAATLPAILQGCGVADILANQIGEIIGSHHGIFATTNELNKLRRSLKQNGPYVGDRNRQIARQGLATYLADLLGLDLNVLKSPPGQKLGNALVMLIAGLVSVADWIGSNSSYFRLKVKNVNTADLSRFNGTNYLRHTTKKGRKALQELGWLGWPEQREARDFFELFPTLKPFGAPLPAQQAILDLPKSMPLSQPGLVIIEEQMGAGKTEAAIALADRWNVDLGQRGIYFALPTMATSNQMFGRVCEYLTTRFPGVDVPVYLLHGRASLISDFKDIRDNKARATAIQDISCDGLEGRSQCPGNLVAADWFTYRKRGLLPPFGALPGLVCVEIEASAMKVDGYFEVFHVAKAARGLLDLLNLRVHSFSGCVRHPVCCIGDDIFQMVAEHPGYFLDRFQAASDCPRVPILEELSGIARVAILP